MISMLESIRDIAGDQRKDTFEAAAKFILELKSPVLVETGCYRGTWADGRSTLILATLARETNGILLSHDLSLENINAASQMISEAGLSRSVQFEFGDSAITLKSIFHFVDFAYLDSYDFEENDKAIRPQAHQLVEVGLLLPKMAPVSAFLLDDCDLPFGGKAGLSVQPIHACGYSCTVSAYQKLFIRK